MGRTYIIAEAGVNHNGSLQIACELVDQAVYAGADAVKFQTFIAEEVAASWAPKASYQERLTPAKESQLEMIQILQLSEEQLKELLHYCQSRGIDFLSTPFDLDSLKFLVQNLKLPRIKIGSGDITNAPLLLAVSRAGVKVILSTGMSFLSEVENALAVLAVGYCGGAPPSRQALEEAYSSPEGQKALREKVALLHCTTEYPASLEAINLLAMDTLGQAFGLPVGYSDHSPGIVVPVAAVARGAVVIEKHLTLDRGLPGPDHKASLEPLEFKAMVEAIRQVEVALGSPIKQPARSEMDNRILVRRSLVARKWIKKGESFTEENPAVKRPGNKVSPLFYWDYLGMPADKDYQPDEQIGFSPS